MRSFRNLCLVVAAGLGVACSGGGGGGRRVVGTRPGDTLAGGVRVTAVDTAGLASGTASVTVSNATNRRSSQLQYRLDVYYETGNATKPFDVEQSGWKPLVLAPGQSAKLTWKAPRPHGHHLELRMRAKAGQETAKGDQLLEGRVVVDGVDKKDEFATPAKIRYVVRSKASSTLRVRYSVRFERDGRKVAETPWKSAKLVTGRATTIEVTTEGLSVAPLTTDEVLQMVLVGES